MNNQVNCKIWAKWSGSDINESIPMMKTEHYFQNVCDPQIILDALLSHRMQWDPTIECFEELEQYRSGHTSVHRLLGHSVMNLSQREFIDKKLVFTRREAAEAGRGEEEENDSDHGADNQNHGAMDDIYIWVTSVPNELYPMESKFVRSDSLVGIIRIGRVSMWDHAARHF